MDIKEGMALAEYEYDSYYIEDGKIKQSLEENLKMNEVYEAEIDEETNTIKVKVANTVLQKQIG